MEDLIADRCFKGYIDDIELDDMLYLAFVRSRYARARIGRVEKADITSKELAVFRGASGEGAIESNRALEPVFTRDTVNYYQQPIAAVVADDRYAAYDKARDVEVEYLPLEPITSIEESLKKDPIHKGMSSNINSYYKLGAPFNIDYDIKIEARLYNDRIVPDPLETRGIVACYDRDNDKLKIYISTQSVISIRRGLANSLNIPESKIEVIQSLTGGGFGVKGALYPEYIVAAYAAMKYNRPVKWIETREEHIAASNPGRGVLADLRLYAGSNGAIKGLEGKIYVDNGAYSGTIGDFAPRFIGMQITGAYKIDNINIDSYSVFTNKAPIGPYRGAGRPEAAFFMERLIDKLADRLDLDPFEIRLMNMPENDYRSPLSLEIKSPKRFFERAFRLLKKEINSKEAYGVASFVLVSGVGPGESIRLKVKDKKLNIYSGANSHGQGHSRLLKEILSRLLGVSRDDIVYNYADSDYLDDGTGSWGSRSAIALYTIATYAAAHAINAVYKRYNQYKPELLLSSDIDVYIYKEFKGQHNSLLTALVSLDKDYFDKPVVKKVVFVADIGMPIAKENVYNQIKGGIMQSIGQLYSERVIYDNEGVVLNRSLVGAGVQTAINTPKRVKIVLISSRGLGLDDISNYIDSFIEASKKDPEKAAEELLSKSKIVNGIGEAPLIGVVPALARALERLYSKEVNETPTDVFYS
ncbi:MAG: glyceraldehyde dehydrogenase large chain [Candidatus Micrarchaeota archaeon]|nr:MAG: glyceraldehyde dehydrogenase large chain [Candidatus Micrarchaeota archaeon]